MSDPVVVTKRFRWSMAHRLTHGYQGACASLHGHDYTLEVAVRGIPDEQGLVIDFAELKRIAGGWLKANLDHATLVFSGDKALLRFLEQDHQRHYVVDFNTTAENLVTHIKGVLQRELAQDFPGLEITRLILLETPDNTVIF